jgi:hypothetical protein
MKDESPPPDGKSPHERFVALGKRVMGVPRSEVAALEKKWQARKRPRKRK